ncbi:MAG: V-type ATP synthase subunit A [Firmicutes bacterium]|nr:V-type ATP synthase subunit A [Bacillota bacterium]
MTQTAKVYGINGPVITVTGGNFFVSETVNVGGLQGEVIALQPGTATVQVYESTAGLKPGTIVTGTGQPMSVTMQPGIVGNIFDGIMRPLGNIDKKPWRVRISAAVGQHIKQGEIFAVVDETPLITYRAMVPPGVSGTVTHAAPSGPYTPSCPILTLDGKKTLTLSQTWPIRVPRPVKTRQPLSIPLITGQRVIDSLFPIAKGGVAAIPGSFGTGKTMTQHQLAKWCDADLIVYIGCGERGNEMTEVLEDFAKLTDPKNGQPLLNRTVLIANTSDMPVAAREASVYTGLTIAECYRDMGCHVAVMADSTSRWAEALRELSGRLGEIPAEEGYPAYLATRLSAFYGRAGYVTNLNGTEGSVTIIGAVSPQGGDFSEPVTQQTKRFISCYWALDRQLAYARHFPAICWMNSYSNYLPTLANWYANTISPQFMGLREKIMAVLQEENALLEIVKLAGADGLSESRLRTLALAKKIRKEFLQQNAYDPKDTFMPPREQFMLMRKMTYENYPLISGGNAPG